MKRKMSVLLAVMLLVCSLFAMSAHAETVVRDGIEVMLTTDVESYDALETIHAKLIVKNTNDFDVDDVTAKITAPSGYELAYGGEMTIDMLAAGEEQQVLTSLREEQGVAADLPQTGDDSNGMLWSALFIISAAALCVLTIRCPQTKRVLSILLCVLIMAPYVMYDVPALAQENAAEGRIVVKKNVMVAGKAVTITGEVTYDSAMSKSAAKAALAITAQPKNQTVSAGERAVFTVKATGEGLKYQWYYRTKSTASWKKLTSTKASYGTTMSVAKHGYQYYCKVTDKYKKTVSSKVVTLKLPVAKITTQPKNQTISAGKRAVFTVKATGDGLKYQWYYRTKSSAEWKKLTCTKASYGTTMTAAKKGYQYYCLVTDKYGNKAKSNTVTLKLPAAKITTHPKSQKKAVGERATFTVQATGDGLKYQWYYRTKSTASWKKLSCTKASYGTTMTAAKNGYQYYCEVTDKYGNKAKSNTATLNLVTYDFDYTIKNGKVTITGYTGKDAKMVIPSQVEGYPVTAIGDYCFTSTNSLTSVEIPESVTRIGEAAFHQCQGLSSVRILGSKVSIGDSAFSFCPKLSRVEILGSIADMDMYAFSNCTSLSSIKLPDGLKSIDYFAFGSCTSLSNIEIPGSVTRIGEYAFYDCDSLKSVKIPSGVTRIDDFAFSSCSNLSSIEIPDSVSMIDNDAFHCCWELTIYGYSGSYAETYADEEGFPFVAIPRPDVPPEKPVDVAAATRSSSSIEVSWKKVAGATGYHVFRSADSGSGYSRVMTIASGSTLNFMDTGLKANTTYYYKVRAYNQFGNGAMSAVVSAKTDSEVANETVYRALLIGQTYEGNTANISELPICADDANGMKSMLATMKNTDYTVTTKTDLTESGMKKAIAAAFGAADENDVSLFYYSGHGASSYDDTYVGALVGYDSTYLTVAELKTELDKIKGKKIILLDSCHSGAYIGKSRSTNQNALEQYNEAIISAFASQKKANNLANNNYYVITAAHSSEYSYAGSPYSVFTKYVLYGSGLDQSYMLADRNGDKKISLDECYEYAYTKSLKDMNQHAQVYPENSTFIIWAKQ